MIIQKFIIFTPEGNKYYIKNSFYNEQIYEMNCNTKIKLKADYTGYFPIAIHTWNYNTFDYGDIIISNNKNFISSNTNVSPYMFVKDLYNTNFQIQNNTFITVSNLKKNVKLILYLCCWLLIKVIIIESYQILRL